MNALVITLALVTATLSAAAAVPAQPAAPKGESPLASGAKPLKLADSADGIPFQFTEGATSDKDGNVFFIDQPNDRILKWTFDDDATPDNPKGHASVFLTPSGYSNGMSFDNNGNLISCADEKNQLWRINAQ